MADATESRPPVSTGHVFLDSADLAAAARFYEKIGMRRVAVFEHLAALEMRGGTHVVIRYRPDHVVSGPAGWDLMVDDIEATHDEWQLEGIAVSEIVMESPHRRFEIVDPDGHVVVVRDTHVVGPV